MSVSSSPVAGIEVDMPRTGAYARGIELDVQGKWAESERAFGRAVEEFRQLLVRRPRWRKTILAWVDKAEFQREQSRKLRQQTFYYRPQWRQRFTSAHTYLYRAVAKHNKWLGIRAFTGRPPRKLADAALSDYRRVLSQPSDNALARLALAALHHELGEHEKGRREFARLQQPPSRWMAVNVAYYYAAAGKTDKALDHLEQAVRYSSSVRKHVLQSNDFDRLRSHPRFRRLFGN